MSDKKHDPISQVEWYETLRGSVWNTGLNPLMLSNQYYHTRTYTVTNKGDSRDVQVHYDKLFVEFLVLHKFIEPLGEALELEELLEIITTAWQYYQWLKEADLLDMLSGKSTKFCVKYCLDKKKVMSD